MRLLALIALTGCASGPTKWMGEEAHLELVGMADGAEFSLTDESATVSCLRQYEVPDVDDSDTWASGTFTEIEIGIQSTIDGIETEYELELAVADYTSISAPDVIALADPGELDLPASGTGWLELQWKYEDADGTFVEFEDTLVSGSFELELFSGEVGEDGMVIPSGQGGFGGFFQGKWSDGTELRGTFTVPSCDSEVDVP